MPEDFSTHGSSIDSIIWIVHVFMAVLFVGWGAFFVYCLVKFRHKDGQKALYKPIKAKLSKYSEIAVVVVEVILLIGISIPVWAENKSAVPQPEDDPLVVRVVGKQFNWFFHYPGKDGKFGERNLENYHPTDNIVALSYKDPNGADDVVKPTFHLPVDRPILVRLTSMDVIHSFGIPKLRVKADAIPGTEVPLWFTAARTATIDDKVEVHCSQLCGNNHYQMKASVLILSPEEFQTWHDKQSEQALEYWAGARP